MNLPFKTRLPFSAWLCAATFLLGSLIASCSGCASVAQKIDPAFVTKLLEAAGIAPDFRGDVTLRENANAPGGVGFTVTVTDLRQENGRWVWGGLSTDRHGIWSSGGLTIVARPKPIAEARKGESAEPAK